MAHATGAFVYSGLVIEDWRALNLMEEKIFRPLLGRLLTFAHAKQKAVSS